MTHLDTSGLVPLADRIRWTSAVRGLVVLAPVVLWLTRPGPAGDPVPIVVAALAYLLLTAAAVPLLRVGRRAALFALTVGLLLDGVYLAWAFLALDGFAGPIGYLLVLHAVAVTLLTSFRSGLKVVLWQSLTLMLAVQAEVVGWHTGQLTGEPFPGWRFGVLLATIWTATMATSTFAAVNERELRRRRYDAEVLRRLALDLERITDPDEIAQVLAVLTHRELLARRAVVVAFPCVGGTASGTVGGTAGARSVIGLAPGGTPTGWAPPAELPPGSSIAAVMATRRTTLVRRADVVADPWLATLLPEAQNLVLLPFDLNGQVAGALLLEHGPATWLARLLRREPSVELRRIATAEQATAHAAQAFARAALVARLRSSADTDGLTDLANRRAFDRALHAELARGHRTDQPTSVLLIDVDHFKAVNDTFGHQAGDEALRDLAGVLAATARAGDLPARYGGEEFAVLLPATDLEGARAAAERLRSAVADAGLNRPLTVSIGAASTGGDAWVAQEDLLAAADDALYAAKARGRDQVVTAAVPVSR